MAFTWLLGHVSPALAGSYAYINPVVALLVGRLIADETLTLRVIGAMVIILAGVALVRAGAGQRVLVELEPSGVRASRKAEAASVPAGVKKGSGSLHPSRP